MAYIVTRPLHPIKDTLSLNEAQQLIRKLTRPIAETTKNIEQNLQLAQKHKENILRYPQLISKGLLQQNVRIERLDHPRTVCVSETCTKIIFINNQSKVEYTSKCHERCYLKGITQETINNPAMLDCEAINLRTGLILLFRLILYLLPRQIEFTFSTHLFHCEIRRFSTKSRLLTDLDILRTPTLYSNGYFINSHSETAIGDKGLNKNILSK